MISGIEAQNIASAIATARMLTKYTRSDPLRREPGTAPRSDSRDEPVLPVSAPLVDGPVTHRCARVTATGPRGCPSSGRS
jgi:hypothetical protein